MPCATLSVASRPPASCAPSSAPRAWCPAPHAQRHVPFAPGLAPRAPRPAPRAPRSAPGTHFLVPGLSGPAAAAAATAASALREAGSRAVRPGREKAKADPLAAARALAKARPQRRLAAKAASLKALKRRAHGRERAEHHRATQAAASSSGLPERRSAEEHFGRTAADRSTDEAAELAALGPPTRGLAKRAGAFCAEGQAPHSPPAQAPRRPDERRRGAYSAEGGSRLRVHGPGCHR